MMSEVLILITQINTTDMDDNKKLKIKTFHALLARLGIMSYKADMLCGYGVESTSQLEAWELDELIQRLRDEEQARRHKHDAELRSLRSIALTVLQRMGIYKDTHSWRRVNEYLLNPRIAGKLLYDCNSDELRALIKKLRGIERKHQDKKSETDRLILNN